MLAKTNRPGFSYGRRALLGAFLTGAVLFSSCGGSGFIYVGTDTDRAYFKVPGNWTKFNKQQVLVAIGLDLSPDSQSRFRYLVGYDSDPNPSIDHVANPLNPPTYPAVLAWVRKLDVIDRQTFSLTSMRNAFYPVDQWGQDHRAELLSSKDLALPGGFHGAQIVYDVSNGNYSLDAGNLVLRVAQIGLLDAQTNLFYLFVVRCVADCYSQNQSLIDQIVNSYIVKEH